MMQSEYQIGIYQDLPHPTQEKWICGKEKEYVHTG